MLSISTFPLVSSPIGLFSQVLSTSIYHLGTRLLANTYREELFNSIFPLVFSPIYLFSPALSTYSYTFPIVALLVSI